MNDKGTNIGTGQVVSTEGSMCHHRLVPRGHVKVKVLSLCSADPVPYPWTDAIYWCAEPVLPNSFMVWPKKSIQLIKQNTSDKCDRYLQFCKVSRRCLCSGIGTVAPVSEEQNAEEKLVKQNESGMQQILAVL